MKTQILALLREQFQGERQDGLALLAGSIALQVSNLEEAESIIDKLTSEAVSDFVKGYRSEVDREKSHSLKAFKEKIEREDKDKEEEPHKESEGNTPELEKLLSEAITKAIAPLQEQISKYESKETERTRLTSLEEALRDCTDEHFAQQARKAFGRMTFADEEAFNSYLEELKADATSASERYARDVLGGLRPPSGSGTNKAPSKEEVSAILANIS